MKKEKVQKLYNFLINDINLSTKKTFDIIYYLQETMHIIPSKFEMCNECNCIYNVEYGGYFSEKTGKHYCSWCDTGDRDEL
jgi:hypothetical protein